MKYVLGLVVVLTFAQPAFAFHCPADMAKIDTAIAAASQISTAQTSQLKELRAEGEALHKAGNHVKSIEFLRAAMLILGIA